MTYVGYTPWKKFKKLYDLSRGIIHTYGFRYFFYVMNLEFKKQGLSVFLPDAKPISIFNTPLFDESYQTYLKKLNNKFLSDVKLYDNLSKKPKISIFIIDTKNNLENLQQTIFSLTHQTYENYEIHVLSNSSKHDLKDQNLDINFERISFKKFENDSFYEFPTFNGDYILFVNSGIEVSKYALFEFVKELNQHQKVDVLYSDNDYVDNFNVKTNPFFKPDWSPYLLRSMDYISEFCLVKKSIFDRLIVDSLQTKCLSFDLLLQIIEFSQNILHISIPLYSVKYSSYSYTTHNCMKMSLEKHLKRMNISAKVENSDIKNNFRVQYELKTNPKVSIIIPTKNNFRILKRCIDSIENKTKYRNFEILIIDNLSNDHATKEYYSKLSHKIISYDENFNFSKMNNLAVQYASGELFLFLNDDTKVLDSNWLHELISIITQNDVGIVGTKLIFSDHTIQHAGLVFLQTGSGFHPLMKQHEKSSGYHHLLNSMRDFSAVTGACLLTKKEIFEQVNGFDNSFDVYYGDADFCLKVRNLGYRVVYTPFTKLLHEGSFTIRNSNASHFDVENHLLFLEKWPYLKNGDPYYNTNLDWDYSISDKPFE